MIEQIHSCSWNHFKPHYVVGTIRGIHMPKTTPSAIKSHPKTMKWAVEVLSFYLYSFSSLRLSDGENCPMELIFSNG